MVENYEIVHREILRLIDVGDLGEAVNYFFENSDLYDSSGNGFSGRVSMVEAINGSMDYPGIRLELTREISVLEMDKFFDSLYDCLRYG